MNKLYFGDNLDVLRQHVKDESVDLIYLDPPFNSNANYNVLFKEAAGKASEAQAEAFKDTWGWGETAALAFDDVMKGGGDLAVILRAFRTWLGDSPMMAYLAMMAVRMGELQRVLKPTGSLYLHCDPTASHYLKIVLDGTFGPDRFQNEVIWKRTTAHNSAKKYSPVHDVILFYRSSNKATWNSPRGAYEAAYLDKYYKFDDGDGRLYWRADITGAGVRKGDSGLPWRGRDPSRIKRHWALPEKVIAELAGPAGKQLTAQQKLDLLDENGLIYWPKGDGMPQYKRFRDQLRGPALGDVWDDLNRLNPVAGERLGYPTQKPVALLERIIAASSNSGDVVLDPFCGCGTTVEAAERQARQWIGIDVTHYAVTLIENRLKAHPAARYSVHGRPTDLSGAVELARRDKYQFQWWAAWLLGAQTYENKKGADRGIDANIFFANGPYGYGRIIISVKGGDNVSPVMVRELSGVLQREDAEMGILITLAEPTKSMLADAAGAGFVGRSAHGRLPRVQVVTVGDLLAGRMPRLPPLPVPEHGSTARPRKRDKDQLELLLPFAGAGVATETGAIVDPRFLKLG